MAGENFLCFFCLAVGNENFVFANSFGYFRFDEVEVGQTYIFNVIAKKYIFMTQVVSVTEEIDGLNFTSAQWK